jgi:hypothetical protein
MTTRTQANRKLPLSWDLLRGVWVVLVGLSAAVHIIAIPIRLEQPWMLGWDEWSQAETEAAWDAAGLSLAQATSLFTWLDIFVPFLHLALALFIFWRKPKEKIAVLMASVFLLLSADSSVQLLKEGYGYAWFSQVGLFLDVTSSVLPFMALFLFPDGKYKPGWVRWVLVFLIGIQVWRLFYPQEYEQSFLVVRGLTFLLLAVALFQRYTRYSNQIQRLQIKWVIFSLVSILGSLGLYLIILMSMPSLKMPSPAGVMAYGLGSLLWMSFALVFPITIVIAIFRSHLWDIDLVIRRTLIYTVLTLLLAVIYLGAVAVLQTLFTTASAQNSPLGIVVSTLGIAALFNPLRHRIQAFIDRRFYRHKYNAEQALAAFAALARCETDISSLAYELNQMVSETLQPESVQLWLREKSERSPAPQRLEVPRES